MGNICRSPLAEGVFRALVERAGLSSAIKVDSAGTHANRDGESPDPRARRVAASRAYNLSALRSRRVSADDYTRFDLILAMDRQNLDYLHRYCPAEYQPKLRLFLEFAEGLAADEVPDPYFGGAEGFEKVLDLCENAARGLLAAIVAPGSKYKVGLSRASSDSPW